MQQKLLQKSQPEINHISVLCIKLYLKNFNFQIRIYKLKKIWENRSREKIVKYGSVA